MEMDSCNSLLCFSASSRPPRFKTCKMPDLSDHMKLDDLTATIIGAAIKVHRALGPGLLESAYRACLMYELEKHGLP